MNEWMVGVFSKRRLELSFRHGGWRGLSAWMNGQSNGFYARQEDGRGEGRNYLCMHI